MWAAPPRTAHRNRWEMKHPGPQRTDSLDSERPVRKARSKGLAMKPVLELLKAWLCQP